jgi:hypothetical protein
MKKRSQSDIGGAWNGFDALYLVVAVTLGITSAQGSPIQVFEVGAGSTALQFLPWSFIRTVLVPFYLILHTVLSTSIGSLFAFGIEGSEPVQNDSGDIEQYQKPAGGLCQTGQYRQWPATGEQWHPALARARGRNPKSAKQTFGARQ